MLHRKKLVNNETGFAAIIVAVILVLVVALISVGFAQLMTREETNALNRQLSEQAYYAAESGINDAQKAIDAGYLLGKSQCAPFTASYVNSSIPAQERAGAQFLENNQVNDSLGGSATGASYPCLLIDNAPFGLEYGSVQGSGGQPSTVTELTGVDAADETTITLIDKLVISWQDTNSGKTFASPVGPGLTAFGSSDSSVSNPWTATTGVLRVALTKLVSGGINRSYLANNTFTAFLYPGSSGVKCTTISCYSASQFDQYTGNASGGIIDGQCNTGNLPRYCNVVITNMGEADFLLDMRSIYRDAAVYITAYDSSGNQLRLINGQSVIDSTGAARGTLRRLQVRVPDHNNYVHPDYSLETGGNICKQLSLYPSSGQNSCSP